MRSIATLLLVLLLGCSANHGDITVIVENHHGRDATIAANFEFGLRSMPEFVAARDTQVLKIPARSTNHIEMFFDVRFQGEGTIEASTPVVARGGDTVVLFISAWGEAFAVREVR